jgi:RNA-directed DNA polymerase
VVQTDVKLVVEPIFEADLEPNAYGYRPGRSAADAIKAVHELLCQGYTDVVDADLSKYFDTIPHAELMQCVARRMVDRNILGLIKMWLKAPVEERGGDGTRRMTGWKDSSRGTPQGGVISPLLANLYMNRFLKYWQLTGRTAALSAHVVSYADDFVIVSRGHAAEALEWTKVVMGKLGLTLNEAKTSVRDARAEQFNFLGYAFGPHRRWKTGQQYLGASPSKKSVARLKDKVAALLGRSYTAPWPEVREQLNSMLRGWSAYFGYGARWSAYRVGLYLRLCMAALNGGHPPRCPWHWPTRSSTRTPAASMRNNDRRGRSEHISFACCHTDVRAIAAPSSLPGSPFCYLTRIRHLTFRTRGCGPPDSE